MNSLKGTFARSVIERWKELHAPVLERLRVGEEVRFWQRGGGYDRNITSDQERIEKMNYIHTNPVRRGLVTKPSEWMWSSAREYEGYPPGPLRVDRIS